MTITSIIDIIFDFFMQFFTVGISSTGALNKTFEKVIIINIKDKIFFTGFLSGETYYSLLILEKTDERKPSFRL